MLAALKKVNPKQHQLVIDEATHIGALCPRRAGKTFAATMAALITGEAKPGAISIIISLNKQQLRRLYWEDGSSGLYVLAQKYKLQLEFNNTFLRWRHENGSVGYLLGADDDDQLEVLRGLEADLYVIDECKSFSVSRLQRLLVEIIEPQRASRKGRVILIGTPGHTQQGPFYRATCADACDADGRMYLLPFGEKDAWGRDQRADRLWSFHHWTLEENRAMPHQWEEALITKRTSGWSDTDPTWCREYLGLWTTSSDGLVFRYATERGGGRLNWAPERTPKNPTGLPVDGAPWRLIGGLDIGFEDATALVICAYSARYRQLRHVFDYSRPHMLVDDVADLIREAYERFGNIEKIFADAGGLGKMVVETLVQRHGFPIEKADKREKYDYIELLNSAFARGEVLIIEGTTLEEQLLTGAWELGNVEKSDLAKLGRLREDPSIKNDSSDALLYLYRGSLHQFGAAPLTDAPVSGSPEWVKAWERDQLKKARDSFKREANQKLGDTRFTRAPAFVRAALRQDPWTQSIPTSSKRF